MSARAVVQDTVRKWAVDEARDIERGFISTPTKVTAADAYSSKMLGVSESELADSYAATMDAAMYRLMEARWAAVEARCAEWGVTL